MRLILGCDPGAKGGLALVSETGQAEAWEMPPTAFELLEFLRLRAVLGLDGGRAYVEHVHAWPGQGVSSAFSFGRSYGELLCALTAVRISFESVSPGKWQAALGMRRRKGEAKTAYKRRLKVLAKELFPGVEVTLGTADALLIAEWARRREAGNG